MATLAAQFKSKSRLKAENAALRHQLIVLRRKVPGRVRFTNNDRWFFIQLYRWFPSILKALTIIRPETFVRWHRTGFRCYWRWMGIRTSPRAGLALAEWFCRTADRIDPARVCGSFHHLRRGAFTAHPASARYYNDIRTHRSLDKDAPVSRPVQRIYKFTRDPGRTSSPLRAGLGFRYTQGLQVSHSTASSPSANFGRSSCQHGLHPCAIDVLSG